MRNFIHNEWNVYQVLCLYNSMKTNESKRMFTKGLLKCLPDNVYSPSGRMSSNSSCAIKRRASSASNMIAFWIPFSNSSPNVIWEGHII